MNENQLSNVFLEMRQINQLTRLTDILPEEHKKLYEELESAIYSLLSSQQRKTAPGWNPNPLEIDASTAKGREEIYKFIADRNFRLQALVRFLSQSQIQAEAQVKAQIQAQVEIDGTMLGEHAHKQYIRKMFLNHLQGIGKSLYADKWPSVQIAVVNQNGDLHGLKMTFSTRQEKEDWLNALRIIASKDSHVLSISSGVADDGAVVFIPATKAPHQTPGVWSYQEQCPANFKAEPQVALSLVTPALRNFFSQSLGITQKEHALLEKKGTKLQQSSIYFWPDVLPVTGSNIAITYNHALIKETLSSLNEQADNIRVCLQFASLS